MYGQRLRADDPEFTQGEYSPTAAYARSKRAQVELLPVLAERWSGDGIGVHATHPGWADTPGVVDSLPRFHKLTGPLLRDAEGGADTTVWLGAVQPQPPLGRPVARPARTPHPPAAPHPHGRRRAHRAVGLGAGPGGSSMRCPADLRTRQVCNGEPHCGARLDRWKAVATRPTRSATTATGRTCPGAAGRADRCPGARRVPAHPPVQLPVRGHRGRAPHHLPGGLQPGRDHGRPDDRTRVVAPVPLRPAQEGRRRPMSATAFAKAGLAAMGLTLVDRRAPDLRGRGRRHGRHRRRRRRARVLRRGLGGSADEPAAPGYGGRHESSIRQSAAGSPRRRFDQELAIAENRGAERVRAQVRDMIADRRRVVRLGDQQIEVVEVSAIAEVIAETSTV